MGRTQISHRQPRQAVRISARGDAVVLLFHCSTEIVAQIRDQHGDALDYEANRAIILHGEMADDLGLIGALAAKAFAYSS